MNGDRRKLKKNDHESENILRKLLPGFLKFKEEKNTYDIKIDEHRNILYSVSSLREQPSEIVIDVFDLGSLGNKFEKLATLKQSQIL